jgi:hypothetical protein
MCVLVDHYIQISYRAGRECRPPNEGSNIIPIGVFASTGAGSRGIHVRYRLRVLGEGARFEGGKSEVTGSLYAAQGGYRAKWDPNHGLNVSHAECCAEGDIHVLEGTAPSSAEKRVPVQLDVEWEPIRSPFSPISQLDADAFSGELDWLFAVVFR